MSSNSWQQEWAIVSLWYKKPFNLRRRWRGCIWIFRSCLAQRDENIQPLNTTWGKLHRRWMQINSKSIYIFTDKRCNDSILLQFLLHAALDRIEEVLGSSKNNTVARWQRGSHWIGCICRMEETEIYGYVTASNIKILAMIRSESIIPLKKNKEVDIKLLFVSSKARVQKSSIFLRI